jgi:hypothetical protein
MKLKQLGLAFFAILMLGSIAANSAMAEEAVTKPSFWYTAGVKATNGQTKVVTCAAGEHEGSKTLRLNGTIGEGAGTPVELTATSVSCIKHNAESTEPGATIVQAGSSAQAIGRIQFGGVAVAKPTGCTVASTLTTNPLKSEVYMESGSTTKVFQRFEPTGTEFLKVTISGCSVAGTYAVKGFTYGEALNPTNKEATTQSLTFSEAIEKTAKGTLKFAGNPAYLTGRVDNTLEKSTAFKANES